MNGDLILTDENVLGLISDNCPDLLALLDVNGMFLYGNAAHLVRLGRTSETLLGCTIYEMIHADDVERVEKAIAASARRRTLLRLKARWVRDSGRCAEFESLGKWVSADEGQSQYLLLASRESSEGAAPAHSNGEASSLVRDAALLLARLEGERTQLARTIHDDLGQKLTAVSIELSLWKTEVDGGQSRSVHAIREKIAILSELAAGMIGATRQITASLRPRILEEFGVVAAIEWLLEKFQNRTGITCHFTSKPEKIEMNGGIAAQLFRVIEEITRTVDARVATLQVRLEKRASTLSLRVQADGAALKVSPEAAARARIMGGELESERGSLVLTLPLK